MLALNVGANNRPQPCQQHLQQNPMPKSEKQVRARMRELEDMSAIERIVHASRNAAFSLLCAFCHLAVVIVHKPAIGILSLYRVLLTGM
jgi:hypothetical protein